MARQRRTFVAGARKCSSVATLWAAVVGGLIVAATVATILAGLVLRVSPASDHAATATAHHEEQALVGCNGYMLFSQPSADLVAGILGKRLPALHGLVVASVSEIAGGLSNRNLRLVMASSAHGARREQEFVLRLSGDRCDPNNGRDYESGTVQRVTARGSARVGG